MILRLRLGLRPLLVLSTLCCLSNCGIVTWREIYRSSQPHGDSKLIVQERCGLSDCAIEVNVKKGWTSRRIAYERGCVLYFAHAVWAGSTIGLFADAQFCRPIKVAFDVDQGREIPFIKVEGAIRSDIMKTYHVRPSELDEVGGDVFTWASYLGDGQLRRGTQEFHDKYLR